MEEAELGIRVVRDLGFPIAMAVAMAWAIYRAGSALVAAHVEHLKGLGESIKANTEHQAKIGEALETLAETQIKTGDALENLNKRISDTKNEISDVAGCLERVCRHDPIPVRAIPLPQIKDGHGS